MKGGVGKFILTFLVIYSRKGKTAAWKQSKETIFLDKTLSKGWEHFMKFFRREMLSTQKFSSPASNNKQQESLKAFYTHKKIVFWSSKKFIATFIRCVCIHIFPCRGVKSKQRHRNNKKNSFHLKEHTHMAKAIIIIFFRGKLQ